MHSSGFSLQCIADPRIASNTRRRDLAVLLILWAQRVVTFRPGAAQLIADVPWVFKTHIVLGLTIFLIFPFTRLVHIWSGFASVAYLFRPYQLVRTRRKLV